MTFKFLTPLLIPTIIIVAGIIGGISGYKLTTNFYSTPLRQDTTKFIIVNPIDLDEIVSISPFRSCMGHDFSGKNTDREEETNRSMKHYITQKSDIKSAKAIAPFDGRIAEATEQQIGGGTNVFIKADNAPGWIFIFFHIDLEPGLKEGSRVMAGEIIGHSVVGQAENFDFALKKFEGFAQILDTPFNHMADEILAEYKQKGITAKNMVISKEQRDANPCTFGQGSGDDEQIFLR